MKLVPPLSMEVDIGHCKDRLLNVQTSVMFSYPGASSLPTGYILIT